MRRCKTANMRGHDPPGARGGQVDPSPCGHTSPLSSSTSHGAAHQRLAARSDGGPPMAFIRGNTLSCTTHTVERRKCGIKNKKFSESLFKRVKRGRVAPSLCLFFFLFFSKQTSYTQSKLSCVPLRSAPIIALPPLPQS